MTTTGPEKGLENMKKFDPDNERLKLESQDVLRHDEGLEPKTVDSSGLPQMLLRQNRRTRVPSISFCAGHASSYALWRCKNGRDRIHFSSFDPYSQK